jgi:5-methylcytosine-specific restriction endonuclease McrA
MDKSITCAINGCDKTPFCRIWCSGHYHRWQRYGSPFPPEPKPCLQCREVFTPKRVDTRYCSDKCMDRAKVENARAQYAQMKRAYYIANLSDISVKQKKYYGTNRARIRLLQRKHYLDNRDSILEYQRAYRIKNAAAIAEQRKAFYYENIDAVRAYRVAHKEAIAASVAAWSKRNPTARRENESRRRVRRIENGVFVLSPRDLRGLNDAQVCAHCATDFSARNPKHVDHVIPIAKGGRHSIGNLQALCSNCNTSKHDQLYSVWRYRGAKHYDKPRSPGLYEIARHSAC